LSLLLFILRLLFDPLLSVLSFHSLVHLGLSVSIVFILTWICFMAGNVSENRDIIAVPFLPLLPLLLSPLCRPKRLPPRCLSPSHLLLSRFPSSLFSLASSPYPPYLSWQGARNIIPDVRNFLLHHRLKIWYTITMFIEKRRSRCTIDIFVNAFTSRPLSDIPVWVGAKETETWVMEGQKSRSTRDRWRDFNILGSTRSEWTLSDRQKFRSCLANRPLWPIHEKLKNKLCKYFGHLNNAFLRAIDWLFVSALTLVSTMKRCGISEVVGVLDESTRTRGMLFTSKKYISYKKLKILTGRREFTSNR
jgi:hypothetical protein